MKEHTQHKKRFPLLVWLPFVAYYVMQYKVYILNIKNEKVVTFFIYIMVGMIAWLISLANMLAYVKKYHWLVILLYCIIFVYFSA